MTISAQILKKILAFRNLNCKECEANKSGNKCPYFKAEFSFDQAVTMNNAIVYCELKKD